MSQISSIGEHGRLKHQFWLQKYTNVRVSGQLILCQSSVIKTIFFRLLAYLWTLFYQLLWLSTRVWRLPRQVRSPQQGIGECASYYSCYQTLRTQCGSLLHACPCRHVTPAGINNHNSYIVQCPKLKYGYRQQLL